MAKKRKSRTAGFLDTQTKAELPTPEQVNKVVARVTGKENDTSLTSPKNVILPSDSVSGPKNVMPPPKNVIKRVPLTTAITPENRAKLEVASINGEGSVADLLNEALTYYFREVLLIQDATLVDTFKKIYARKIK